MSTERIFIGLQKGGGRLNKDSVALVEECGFTVRQNDRRLWWEVPEMPVTIMWDKDDAILEFVNEGKYQLGIVGKNVFDEARDNRAEIIRPLGFSKVGFAIAVPNNSDITSLSQLQGRTIATSYPNLMQDFLDENGIGANVFVKKGSLESVPFVGLADAIYDICETGKTAKQNGLRFLPDVKGYQSEAGLLRAPVETLSPAQASIISDFQGLLDDVLARRAAPAPEPVRILELAPGRPPRMDYVEPFAAAAAG